VANEQFHVKRLLPGVSSPSTEVDNTPALELLAFKYFATVEAPLAILGDNWEFREVTTEF
jgi:hypothetical protein